MSTFYIALVLFAAQADQTSNSQYQPLPTVVEKSATSSDDEKTAAPTRQGKELEEGARAALRRWATTSKRDAESAAREFIGVFNELKDDSTLPRSTRRELGMQVRNRLAKLAEVIARSQSKNRGGDAPASVAKRQAAPQILGQLQGGGNRPLGGGNQAGRGQIGGGARMNNSPPDAGEDLVALIQKTISPASWDINGGPGTIMYWRPGRAIVVRASDRVHEQIGGVIGQLQGGQQ